MKSAFIGFTTKAVDNAAEFFPTLPPNQPLMANLLLTGRFDKVSILLPNGNKLHEDPERPILDKLTEFHFICGYRIFDFLDFAIKECIEKIGVVPTRCQWAKLGRHIRYPFMDPASLGRRVIFDPIEVIGGVEAAVDPTLLIKYYKWDIPKLETADDYAQLSMFAGSYFLSKG